MFRVIAFYTKDTPYEEEIKGLIESCELFDIPIDVRAYPCTGSWVTNAALKPIFVSSMLAAAKEGEILVYLDADARIREYPTWFDTFKGNVAVHYRNGKELLSGTIALRNTEEVRGLMRIWVGCQQKYPREWDQKTLQRVVGGYATTPLPPSYVQIFDTMAHHGAPVIEHLQASRRHRGSISMSTTPKPLPQVGKVAIRTAHDNTYWIPRKCAVTIKYMDKHFTRVGPNALRWYPAVVTPSTDHALIKSSEHVYIVGKGPSLDHLRAEHFPRTDSVIVAINEAIHAVELLGLPNPIYGFQQDVRLKDTCKPQVGKMIASVKSASFYPDALVVDPRKYGLSLNAISTEVAICVFKEGGANDFTLLCFDASVNGETGYAKTVGYSSSVGGSPSRFLLHKSALFRAIGSCKYSFELPEAERVVEVSPPTEGRPTYTFQDEELKTTLEELFAEDDDTPQQ